MKIRRFFAPDMRRAIQLVRSEHGADAVILSSRAVDGGMEIVSAVDYDQELINEMMQPQGAAPARAAVPAPAEAPAAPRTAAPAAGRGRAAAASSRAVPTDAVTAASSRAAPAPTLGAVPVAASAAAVAAVRTRTAADLAVAADAGGHEQPALTAIRSELEAMRCMLRAQLAHLRSADLKMLDPERALLASRVASLGLEPDLAETLVAEVEHPENARAWREVMFGLARRLRVPKHDPLDDGGIFALVGPTGVGKTTTIAKLAARHCLRHGRESIALISTDTLRVGAQRQLGAFGAILGVPVRHAADGAELSSLLHDLRDRRLVLIDTAGMASRDRKLARSLGQLDVERRIRRYLVIAANMQAGVMDEAVRAFGGPEQLAGVVLTKLDEAQGLGAALSVLIRQRLKAVWLAHGQRVPEDLRVARGMHLLGWALDEPVSDEPPARLEYPAGRRAAFTEVAHAAV